MFRSGGHRWASGIPGGSAAPSDSRREPTPRAHVAAGRQAVESTQAPRARLPVFNLPVIPCPCARRPPLPGTATAQQLPPRLETGPGIDPRRCTIPVPRRPPRGPVVARRRAAGLRRAAAERRVLRGASRLAAGPAAVRRNHLARPAGARRAGGAGRIANLDHGWPHPAPRARRYAGWCRRLAGACQGLFRGTRDPHHRDGCNRRAGRLDVRARRAGQAGGLGAGSARARVRRRVPAPSGHGPVRVANRPVAGGGGRGPCWGPPHRHRGVRPVAGVVAAAARRRRRCAAVPGLRCARADDDLVSQRNSQRRAHRVGRPIAALR